MTLRTHHLFRVLLNVSVNSVRFGSPEHNPIMQIDCEFIYIFLLKICYQCSRRWYKRKVNRFQSSCFVGEYYRHNCQSQLCFYHCLPLSCADQANRRNGVRNSNNSILRKTASAILIRMIFGLWTTTIARYSTVLVRLTFQYSLYKLVFNHLKMHKIGRTKP